MIIVIKIEIYLSCGPTEIGAVAIIFEVGNKIPLQKVFKFCNITYRTHILYIISPVMFIQPSAVCSVQHEWSSTNIFILLHMLKIGFI